MSRHKPYKDRADNYQKITEEQRRKVRERTARWRNNNYERSLCMRLHVRARKLNVPFDLKPSDIIVPQFCPVLGIPIERNTGAVKFNSPSVDRIIPSLGYTSGNIIIVSHKANMIKSNATPDEILQVGEFYKNLEKIRGE